MLDSPNEASRKRESDLLDQIKNHAMLQGTHSPKNVLDMTNLDRKSIARMQEELKGMKTRLEKMIPAD